jgi:hypothetical protein
MSSNMVRPLRLSTPFIGLGVAAVVALAAGCWDSNPCNPGQMLIQNACYDPMPPMGTGGAADAGGTGGGGTGGSTGSTTTTGSTMGAGGSDGGADGGDGG